MDSGPRVDRRGDLPRICQPRAFRLSPLHPLASFCLFLTTHSQPKGHSHQAFRLSGPGRFESPPLRQPPPSPRLAGRIHRLTDVCQQSRYDSAETAHHRHGEGELSSSTESRIPTQGVNARRRATPKFGCSANLLRTFRPAELGSCTTWTFCKAQATTVVTLSDSPAIFACALPATMQEKTRRPSKAGLGTESAALPSPMRPKRETLKAT